MEFFRPKPPSYILRFEWKWTCTYCGGFFSHWEVHIKTEEHLLRMLSV